MDVNLKSTSLWFRLRQQRQQESESKACFLDTQIKFSSSRWIRRKDFFIAQTPNTFPTVFFEWTTQEEADERKSSLSSLLSSDSVYLVVCFARCYRGEMMNEFRSSLRLLGIKPSALLCAWERKFRGWLHNFVVVCVTDTRYRLMALMA